MTSRLAFRTSRSAIGPHPSAWLIASMETVTSRATSSARHRVIFTVDETQVAHDAASDGLSPLITNDRQVSPAELLAAYKWQPNLEKRHAQLKGTQLVAPMFLRDLARIEALLCCHFIAMLIQALIEREIRTTMAKPRPPPGRTLALPRRPRLRRTHRRTSARDLRRPRPLPRPPRPRRPTPQDLPARTDRLATPSPRPARHPHQRLPTRHVNAAESPSRSAESSESQEALLTGA